MVRENPHAVEAAGAFENVLGWFKRQGPRYQSRMNAVLRSYMTQRRQSSRKAG